MKSQSIYSASNNGKPTGNYFDHRYLHHTSVSYRRQNFYKTSRSHGTTFDLIHKIKYGFAQTPPGLSKG